MENRRRAERQSAFWACYCHIEDEPSDQWRDCTINDISMLGVGIDLCYPDAVELLGLWQDGDVRLHPSRRITVRVEFGPSINVTIAGELRNAGSGPDGIIRAGIEFVSLSHDERSFVELVERRAVRTLPRHGDEVGGAAPPSPPAQESPESPAFPEMPVLVGQSLALDFAGDAETQPASASGADSGDSGIGGDEPSPVMTPVRPSGTLLAVASPPTTHERDQSRNVVEAAPDSQPLCAPKDEVPSPPLVEPSATSLSQLLEVHEPRAAGNLARESGRSVAGLRQRRESDRSRSVAEPSPAVPVSVPAVSRDSEAKPEPARANGSSRAKPTKQLGETTPSMRVIDIAWLAGLFESVGKMSIAKNGGTRLTIRLTDRDVIDRVNKLVPCTGIQVLKPKPNSEEGDKPRTQYAWRISDSGKVQEVLTLLLPWFGDRQAAKAREVLAHLDSRHGIND